ncbi:MAG: tRNA lysidine(34) synthetase TilS [Sterolibacterium sp.]|nr:tRNA lysidine(34) synthetase TilS [Sterolibacterium sp.]MBP9799591.1 tRNA lysidine(34) synthetase TilS [Sterolibacterium sp.]
MRWYSAASNGWPATANSRNRKLPDPDVDVLTGALARALSRHLPQDAAGCRIVAGFSGGRDSVALLAGLQALQPRWGYRLSACHVHHGLSPQADDWQAFCQDYCQRLGVALTVYRVCVPADSPEGLEAAARRVRYEAFTALEADWLALAHHQGDLAETWLFNLLRGAGLAGLRGMPQVRPLRPGLNLIRPLLQVCRHDIEAYLAARGEAWVEDESNAETRFARNFLRRQVLPLLHQRFPAVQERLAVTAAHIEEAQGLLDELALVDLAGNVPRFPLPLAVLAGLSEPRGRNVLRFLLAQQGVMIPAEVRLKEALRQLLTARPDRHPAVSLGTHVLVRVRREVRLEKTG